MRAGLYAEGTRVPVERTKAELERLLLRYGADEFATHYKRGERAAVAFTIAGRTVRLVVPMPSLDDVERTRAGRRRSAASLAGALEQAERQRWRALLLFLRAKLEACELGLASFDQEFLAHMVTAGGRTVGELLLPELERALAGSSLPALLPRSA